MRSRERRGEIEIGIGENEIIEWETIESSWGEGNLKGKSVFVNMCNAHELRTVSSSNSI